MPFFFSRSRRPNFVSPNNNSYSTNLIIFLSFPKPNCIPRITQRRVSLIALRKNCYTRICAYLVSEHFSRNSRRVALHRGRSRVHA
ncbi:hypothetical protein PUN28_012034 [Cardiocondyla obscurior]|uniref:Uncharacterized protein n=1 Tax=Cardiocondyla obscurior TaxID=286306 RepID=A0AAW2FDB2_9HYME